MAESTLIGGKSEDIVQRMVLDPSQWEKGLQDCAKLIRQQQRHEKDLELVRAELEKRTDSLSGVNQKLGETLSDIGKRISVATLASAALERGFDLVKESIADTIREGMEYSEYVSGHEKAIGRMSESLGGMVKATEIAKQQSKLMTSALHATDEQMEVIGKTAVVYGDRMHISVGQALGSITEKLVGGEGLPKLMRELGLSFEETSNKTFSSMAAIDKMRQAFGDTKPEVHDTKQALQEAGAAWDDFKGAAGAALLQVIPLKSELHGLAGALREVTSQGFGGKSWEIGAWSPTKLVSAIVNKETAATKAQIDKMVERAGTMKLPELTVEYNDKRPGQGRRPELTAAERRLLQEYELQIETERKANEAAVRLTEARDKYAKEQLEFSIWASEAQAKTLQRQVEEGEKRKAQGLERAKELSDYRGMTSFLVGDEGMRNLDATIDRMDRLFGSLEPGTQLMRELNQASKGFSSTLRELGTGTLVQAYGGILNIADAAIQGKGNLGEMVLELGKSTALGLSQTLLAQGLAASIQASAYAAVPFTWPLAAAYSAQAGIFYTGAATLGAIGLGLSAGQAALSGGGPAPSGGGAVSTGESYRPSYGQREEQQPITVENIVYIGGKGDLGAVPWQRAIIQSQVKQRN